VQNGIKLPMFLDNELPPAVGTSLPNYTALYPSKNLILILTIVITAEPCRVVAMLLSLPEKRVPFPGAVNYFVGGGTSLPKS
jgi:hypothetical protein